MYLYNSATHKKEEFIPNHPDIVKMYTCGPTVYHFAHIGNLRTYIMEDVLEKFLRYEGYAVKRVMNITDVGHLSSDGDTGEDKMLKGAKREHKSVMDIARFYTDAFFEDCRKLNIKRPDVVEPATSCIGEYIKIISALLDKGYAYQAGGNVYFDTSTIPQEDLYYLRLYLLLADQLGTKTHTATEMNQLAMQYLYGYTLGTKYPDSGAFANPFVYLQWYALPQDTEDSLDLLLELFGQLDLNPEEVLYAIDQILPQSDLSRADEMDLALLLAQTVSGASYQYAEMLSGQGFYEFLAQQRAQLDADPAAMDTLTAKLQEISGHILHRDNLVVMAAAPADTLDGFCALAGEKLGALPSLPKAQAAHAFPQYPDQFAVVTEGSTTTTAAVLDAKKLENLSGTLFPFLYALENQYLVPTIRFQGLAYSAGVLVSSQLNQLSVYSYSDPNPAASVAAIAQIPDVLAELELTQEELDGYILSAYSLVTRPTGKLERMMIAMQYTLSGFDTGLQQRLAREMLEATPADREAAVEAMRTLWEDMRLVTVGNAALIQAAAEVYDAVYDYRQG